MSDVLANIREFLTHEQVQGGLKAIAIVLIGFLLLRLVRRRIRIEAQRAQQTMIVRRVLTALIVVVTAAWALSSIGFDLRVVLGAAGVLTVAVGFAAQTSVSNLISGIFLVAERPFSLGDLIRVGDVTGEVLSIDSLSIKLRTFDNLLVRIPNETMLKANVTNLTHFTVRRYDMKISVAYKEDIARVREILIDVAHKNPLCLEEPSPLILVLGFGDSALELQFSIWAAKENYLDLRTSMHEEVKTAFDRHGVEIPFPQRTVHLSRQATGDEL
ncbi:MAG: mechanosensitive ion channel family protein [Proteobacteria bacterium]|nr:mechanosensitive ion channel family protein [Pseudomonadota bacterium]